MLKKRGINDKLDNDKQIKVTKPTKTTKTKRVAPVIKWYNSVINKWNYAFIGIITKREIKKWTKKSKNKLIMEKK